MNYSLVDCGMDFSRYLADKVRTDKTDLFYKFMVYIEGEDELFSIKRLDVLKIIFIRDKYDEEKVLEDLQYSRRQMYRIKRTLEKKFAAFYKAYCTELQ